MNSYLYNKKSKKELEKDLAKEDFPRITISFYKYIQLSNLNELRDIFYQDFINLNILGRVYIANEGINAQISIPKHNYNNLLNYLNSHKTLNGTNVKQAIEDGLSFYKLVIKVKKEIVAFGLDQKNFDMKKVGKHLDPLEFNKQLSNPDSVVVDIRNHYESEVGRFKNALVPDVERSQDLLKEIKTMLKGKEDSKILLYCTGGIRCEKASSFLIKNKFTDVNQLSGGVINYAHEVKKNNLESEFIGKNFVFDARMGEKVTKEIISNCHQCDTKSDSHTNCANDLCHLLFIQCERCEDKYKGCCCSECLEYKNLNQEQKEKRKNQFLDFNKNRLMGKIKPKLYKINKSN